MRLVRVGRSALLVEVGSAEEALGLYRAVRSAQQRGTAGLEARDVVPAARSVLLDGVEDLAAAERALRSLTGVVVDTAAPSRRVEVPTVYDGPDLDAVARRWGMTREEAVATHESIEFVVAFCGFAPGFAYCAGLPEALEVARLPSPRTRVPAGSVAVAGTFTGVYPTASPGGWLLLGVTAMTLWDEDAPDPAVLSPGTLVRFVAVRR